MRGAIRFYECEHNGDLDRYVEDLRACGAEILSQVVDEDAEEGVVEVEVLDTCDFLARFKKTDSFGFSNIGD
jgi:hypothetical protein